MIPGPLQVHAGDQRELLIEARTIAEVFMQIRTRYPELAPRLLTQEGELRPLINVFLGEESLRSLHGPETVLADGAIVSIVAAVAGG
jgi:molybdopterin converting factor small subunit